MKMKSMIGSLTAKFAALALSVGLAGGAWATPVAKVGSTEYETIDEAVAAWGPGKTLTLLSDVTYNQTVIVEVNATKSTSNWTLDLGNYRWTASGCHAFQLYAAGGTVMNQNYGLKVYANEAGGITATGKYCIECKYDTSTAGYRPRLEIHGGTYNASHIVFYKSLMYNDTTVSNGPSTWLYKSNDGTEPVFNGGFALAKCPITINAGYFNGTTFNTYPVNDTAKTILQGGHYKNWSAFPDPKNNKGIVYGNYRILVKSDASIDVTNGAPAAFEASTTSYSTFLTSYRQYNGTSSSFYPGLIYFESANYAIRNYNIPIVLSSGVAATESKTLSASGTLTVDTTASGASYTGNITLSNSNAKFVVKFNSDTESDAGYYGTVNAASGKYIHIDETTEGGVVTRTYSVKSNSSSGTQNSQAKVGDLYYDTVYDAFFAVDGNTEGKTITLLKDVSNAGILTNGKAVNAAGKTVVTFDLNGHSFGLQSAGTGNDADYELTVVDSSAGKSGKVTNTAFSLLKIALSGDNDFSGKYTLVVKGGMWRIDPRAVRYPYDGPTYNCVAEGYEVTEVEEDGVTWYLVGMAAVAMAGDGEDEKSYGSIEEAVADVEDNAEIKVVATTTIGSEEVEAGSTVTTSTTGEASNAGSGEAATTVTPKTVTITPPVSSDPGAEPKVVQAYVVSQGSGESAKQSVVTDVDKDATVVSTDANKTEVSDFVDVGKVLANAVASENIDASTVTSMELSLNKEEKSAAAAEEAGAASTLIAAIESATKAFEVKPVATITTTTTEGSTTTTDETTYEVQNSELAANASFTFELDFGVANAGKAVTLTHYASDGTQKGDSWVETVGADGKVSVTLDSFSYLLGTVAETSYYVVADANGKYTVTTEAPAGTPTAYATEEAAIAAYQSSAVARISSDYYETIQAAINAAADGDTIELLCNIQLSGTDYVTINKAGTYTIDGKGYSITPAASTEFAYHRFLFGESGQSYDSTRNYTVKNLTISGFTDSAYLVRAEGCSFTLKDCTLENNSLPYYVNTDDPQGSRVVLATSADLTIDGCVIRNNTTTFQTVDFNTNGNAVNSKDGTFTVTDCLFVGNSIGAAVDEGGHGVIYTYGSTSSDNAIKDSTFSGNTIRSTAASVIYFSGVTDVTGCLFTNNTVTCTSSGKCGVLALGSGAAGSDYTGNAFVDNTLSSSSAYGTIYAGAKNVDLTGSYWGTGVAPAANTTSGADIYLGKTEGVDYSTYATAYAVNESGKGVTVTVQKYFYQDAEDANLWHVVNLAGLKEFRDSVNAGTSYAGKTIRIESDIDMTGTEWTPIEAYPGYRLSGSTIDGANHTIRGLAVVTPAPASGYSYGSGFISITAGELTVKDLVFVDATVNAPAGSQVGTVVGMSYGNLTLSNVDLIGNTVIGITKTGGYVGQNDEGTVSLTDCDVVNTTVSANYSGALMVGLLNVNAVGIEFDNCTADANSKFVWISVAGEFEDKGSVTIAGRTYAISGSNLWVTDPGEGCWAEQRVEGATYGGYNVRGSIFYPAYVATIGNTGYTTLAAALKAANSGDVIEILDGTWGADAIAFDSLTLNEKLTIRTKSLTVQAAEGATPKFVADVFLGYDDSKTVNASMTVRGLAFENAKLSIGEYVQVTVENCSFTGSGANAALAIIDSCVNKHLTDDEYPVSQVTVTGCTFNGTATDAPAIRIRNSGNVTITGNTVANSSHNGILLESNGDVNSTVAKTVIIEDNEITEWNAGNVPESGRAIRLALGTLAKGSTVTVEGNIFRKESLGLDEPDFVKISGAGAGTVDISGNDWNDMLLSEVKGNSAIYSCDSASAPVIGSVITTRKEPVAQIGDDKYMTFAEAIAAAEAYYAENGSYPTITVLDATAEQGNADWKIADGYLVKKVYVAQIVTDSGATTNKYESLREAVNAAQDGDIVKLLADTTGSNIRISASIEIDGDGRTVASSENYPLFMVVAGGKEIRFSNLTIRHEVPKNSTSAYSIYIPCASAVEISGCTIDSVYYGIGVVTANGAELTITDSDISGWSALYLLGSQNCSVEVSGSTLNGNNRWEATPKSNFATVMVQAYDGTSSGNAVSLTDCVVNSSSVANKQVPFGLIGGSGNSIVLGGDGTAVGWLAEDAVAEDTGTGNSLSITGGKFSADPSAFVASGYEAVGLKEGSDDYLAGYRYVIGKIAATDLVPTSETDTSATYTFKVVVTNGNDVIETIPTPQTVTVRVSEESAAADTTLAKFDVADVLATAVAAAGLDNASVTVDLLVSAQTNDTEVASITYDVHPEAIVTVTPTEGDPTVTTNELTNAALDENATFTFRLYTGDVFEEGALVKVTHESEDATYGTEISSATVQGDAGDGKGRYVEITTSHFSTWTIEQVVPEEGMVAVNLDTGVQYASLAAAVSAAGAGDTVALLADDNVSLTAAGSEITVDKPLTITGPVDEEGRPKYTVFGSSSGTLDGNNFNDIFVASSSGTVTISNLAFAEFGNQLANSVNGHAPIFVSSGNNNVVLENLAISDFNRTAIKINGGEFLVKDCHIDCATDVANYRGGGIDVANAATGSIVGTTIVNVDTYDPTEWVSAALEIIGSGDILVEDCSITSSMYGIFVSTSAGTAPGSSAVTVVNTTVEADMYSLINDSDSADAEIAVESGSYTGMLYAETETGLSISGGSFDDEVPEEYCADGYIPAEQDPVTGMYTVKAGSYVAAVYDDSHDLVGKYESLPGAVAAVPAGGTVELLADVDLGTTGLTIGADKSFTLDIGDCDITGAVNGKLVTNYGTVTIEGDTGCVYNTDVSAQGHDAFLNNGTATINGGWFGDGDNDRTNANAVNRGAGFRNLGTATVNGGHFTACDNFTNGGYAYAIINGDEDDGPALTINDADVYGSNNGNIANNAGSVTVAGGTFSLAGGQSYYSVYSYSGDTSVLGGTFAKSGNGRSQFCVEVDNDNASNPGSIAVSGGNFTKAVPEEFCADGYIPAEQDSETGMYTVKTGSYVAQIVTNEGATTNKYETLETAYSAATSGDVIEMLADYRLSVALTFNKSVTLTGAVDEDGNPKYTIYGNPTTHLPGGMPQLFINSPSSPVDLTFQNLNFSEFGNERSAAAGYGFIYISKNSNADTHLMISNVTMTAFNCDAITAIRGDLEIVDCVIDGAEAPGELSYGIRVGNHDVARNPTLSIVRTEIRNIANDANWAGAAIVAGASSSITVTDCTITNVSNGITAVGNNADGSARAASVTISNTLIDASSRAFDIGRSGYDGEPITPTQINVTSGTFHGIVDIASQVAEKATIAISGGIFSDAPAADYVADGYAVVANTDAETKDAYPYTVGIPVAQNVNTEVMYETLQDALSEAQNGNTVKLLSDVTIEQTVTVQDKSVVIDGTGHKIIATGGNAANKVYYALYFIAEVEGVSVEIKNMSIEASGYQVVTMFNCDYTTPVKIDNVTMKSDGACIYGNGLSVVDVTNSTLTHEGAYTAGKADVYYSAVMVGYGGTVNLRGTRVYSTDYGVATFPTGSRINIYDSEVTAENVSGKTTVTDPSAIYVWVGDEYTHEMAKNSAVAVHDGAKISGAFKFKHQNNSGVKTAIATIYGGVFSADIAALSAEATADCGLVIAPGYIVVANTDAATKADYPYTVTGDIVYPVDSETAGVPVPVAWIKGNTGLIAEDAPINVDTVIAGLAQNGENGVPLWQSYVLGLNPTVADSRLVVGASAPVATATGYEVTVKGLNVNIPSTLDSGTTVAFRLEEATPADAAAGRWTARSEPVALVEGQPQATVKIEGVSGKMLRIVADIVTKAE